MAAVVIVSTAQAAGDFDQMRADRVGWARLQTPSAHWKRHSRGDPVLAEFLRENTSLNIDPIWYAADVENLGELCKYPMLFSQGVSMIQSATGKSNLGEYIRRGGFLLIDACINKDITPDPDVFLEGQVRFLAQILPETRIVSLNSEHDVFRCYFTIPNGTPPHMYYDNVFDPRWARHGLYAVMIGSRMAGIISLCGLQCGWDRMISPPGHPEACMRMVVNIYTYAMLQGN
jgi:Domain of unknown function (DUF4159)